MSSNVLAIIAICLLAVSTGCLWDIDRRLLELKRVLVDIQWNTMPDEDRRKAYKPKPEEIT